MASYSVARSKHATLAAATVDSVTLTANYSSVEVMNRGTAGDVYFTVDGSTPVSGADDTFVVVPGGSLAVASSSSSDVVKLISSGTPAYTVTGF